jgi:DNA-binding IclR family transcriptional regulator
MIRSAQPTTASSAVASSDLARRVLRALLALTERGGEISVQTVMALVPASPAAVCAMLLALDAEGFVDGDRFRLTMRGFAAAHAPRAIAYERRRKNLGTMRKAIRVA